MLVRKDFYDNDFFGDLFSISKELNRFFDTGTYGFKSSFPLTNIHEDEKHYYIEAEIPGVKKEDLKVNVTPNAVTIEGKREAELKESDNVSTYRLERHYGSFSRSFALDEKIDSTNVEAEYKDGILKIKLSKSADAKPKSITIKSN